MKFSLSRPMEESGSVLTCQSLIQVALQELLADYDLPGQFLTQLEANVARIPLEADIQKPIQGNKVFSCLGLILNKLICSENDHCRAFGRINFAKEILLISLGKRSQCEESSVENRWLQNGKEKHLNFVTNVTIILVKVSQTLTEMTKNR